MIPTTTSTLSGQTAARINGHRRRQILGYITEHGPSALFEIAAGLGVHDHQISGRFSELVRDGLIQTTGERRVKPDTNCPAEVYALRGTGVPPVSSSSTQHSSLSTHHFPTELRLGPDLYQLDALEPTPAPGLPYTRVPTNGGMRLQRRIDFIDCPGCGAPLKQLADRDPHDPTKTRKLYVCGTTNCPAAKGWELAVATRSGKSPVLVIILTST